ncbi:G-protein beta WD-40 repeats containing protein [Reticulomyxa filosa]|uniref:G-protein beta WD-40 repeats containing protein n=1 Tax=Reticulomyxa filosa TaxID=46433 RepID=X6LWY5_RETFI|nr:G-protein beta WD-40 repeats containing protein [Reticulomyxa filosa]|eukprot:ETO05662.1 G-protein beta WD-40 repeats containing protein [Reticulomyxa filosa]
MKSSVLEEEKKEIQLIIQHWIRILNIKLGWIYEFDRLVVNYVMFYFKHLFVYLLITFTGHTGHVYSIDYSTFTGNQFLCSGASDGTVRIWDIDIDKQIQSFNAYSGCVLCVKFSPYHYHNHRRHVICSSSHNKIIRFWDIKHNQQFKLFNKHSSSVYSLKFSPFNYGRYLCSGSDDKTICLWDIETSKALHVFNGHTNCIDCVDISSLQSNNNNKNENNSIGVIGGNGYTICSGSFDKTIRTWDIETTKQLTIFKGHEHTVKSVKYGSNELANTILSGSKDDSVRLWDIRSGQQIQVFNGHIYQVNTVEYSPFVIKNNSEVVVGYSNVVCSGSDDNTIRFWDIRSNKSELYVIKGDYDDDGINCLTFLQLKKKENTYDLSLCYGSIKGPICIWR